jgi:hypothetical protein
MGKIVKHLRSNRGQMVLSVATITSLLLASTAAYLLVAQTQAAALTSVSDTLSSSTAGAVSNHTVVFTLATAIADDSSTITLTFPVGFNMGSVDENDTDISGSVTGEMTTAADCSGAEEVGVDISGQVITFSICNGDNGDLASSETVTIEVGTNATASGTGANQITNPSKTAGIGTADISTISIGGTMSDNGDALVATIEGVDVTVTVDESLSFAIAAVASGSCDAADQDSAVSSNLTGGINVPYGSITANNLVDGCVTLTVGTNASNGYATTIEILPQLLTSGSDTIAEGDCDTGGESCDDTTTGQWATNTNNGFAYCMEDVTGNAAETADGTGWAAGGQCDDATPEFKTFPVAASKQDVMASAGALTASDVSQTAYRLSVSSTQAAGNYSATVTYIATPTF